MCLGDVFNRNKSSAPAPTATVGDEPTIIDQSVRSGGGKNSMKKGSYNQSRAGKAAAAKKSSTKKTSNKPGKSRSARNR